MKVNRIVFAGLALLLAGAVNTPRGFAQGRRGGGGGEEDQAQGRRGGGQQNAAQQTTTQGAGATAPRLPAPEDNISVTHHTANIGGQQITYTATAGTWVLKGDDGTALATVFLRRVHERWRG